MHGNGERYQLVVRRRSTASAPAPSSHTGAGSTTLDLGAGDYRFEAYYSATTMPSGSQVDFYFVPVPAPGAMALLGVAGAIAGARRRA